MGVGSFYWEMCMDTKVQARLQWVGLYEKSKDAGFICRRCGISRPTLRKWYRRYQVLGIRGLSDQSKKLASRQILS